MLKEIIRRSEEESNEGNRNWGLRDDFRPDSDIDVLAEFDPAARVGLFRLMSIQSELSQILGRNVDLNTPGFLSDWFRDEVLGEAEDQYVAA